MIRKAEGRVPYGVWRVMRIKDSTGRKDKEVKQRVRAEVEEGCTSH